MKTQFKHQEKEWLFREYFELKKTQKQIADENNLKQCTVSKWLNIYFSKKELKRGWKYSRERKDLRGENHWTKKYPNHPFNQTLKAGIRKGAKQSQEEIKKRSKKNKGKKHTQETKEKLSKSKMGDKNPQTKMRKEKSPFWKKDKTQEEREDQRKYIEYHQWRKKVYERDSYVCQKCLKNKKTLNAHHIENYSDHKEKRVIVSNGITLCNSCHKEFHNIYGKYNNNGGQINEFLQNKNKRN